jgi:uncharacterized protein (TIGR03067 family)
MGRAGFPIGWLTVALLVSTGGGVLAADPAGDRDRLQGEWRVVHRMSFNRQQVVMKERASFTEDTFDLMGRSGAFVVDSARQPKQLRHIVAPEAGGDPVTIHYIYMIDGDELVLASKCGIADNAARAGPPQEFNAGLVEVIRLRRPPPAL